MVSALMHLGTRLACGLRCGTRPLHQHRAGRSDGTAGAMGAGMAARARSHRSGAARGGAVRLDAGGRTGPHRHQPLALMPGVFGPPMTHREIERTEEAFRGGLGMTWEQHGEHTCHMQSAMSGARQEAFLVPVVLAAFDGAVQRLGAGGAKIVDVGCGAGVAARLLAESFPEATVTGIDPSGRAIAAARRDPRAARLPNLSYEEGVFDDLDRLGPVDLIVTLDVLHDLPGPTRRSRQHAAASARKAGGWWPTSRAGATLSRTGRSRCCPTCTPCRSSTACRRGCPA